MGEHKSVVAIVHFLPPAGRYQPECTSYTVNCARQMVYPLATATI